MSFYQKVVFVLCVIAYILVAGAVVWQVYLEEGPQGGLAAAGVSLFMGAAVLTGFMEGRKDAKEAEEKKARKSSP